ncbi:MAG: RNA 2',3'-cyclic phosphodiesterase [Polyangia bacterium]
MLRLFIAVDLPAELRPAIARLCRGIGGARWTRPEQLHITLRFLGDTAEDRLADLRTRLREVRAPRFELALRGTGLFPPPSTRKPARVLWLGLEPPEPVRALKGAVDGALSWEPWEGSQPLPRWSAAGTAGGLSTRLGSDPETATRVFSPHLTLARFPTGPRHDLDRFLAEHAGFEGGRFVVSSFHLYRSTLRPQGALHEIVESYPLAIGGCM